MALRTMDTKKARFLLFRIMPLLLLVSSNPVVAEDVVVASPRAAVCQRADFRIAIDVGHTETKYGAVSAHGKPEYEFNLRLANELLVKLQNAHFTNSAVMIQTDSDLFKRARALSSRRP